MYFKSTGSLLVGRTPEELDMLRRRVKQLSEAGYERSACVAVIYFQRSLNLWLGKIVVLPFYLMTDCQLDAHCTVAFIEKVYL